MRLRGMLLLTGSSCVSNSSSTLHTADRFHLPSSILWSARMHAQRHKIISMLIERTARSFIAGAQMHSTRMIKKYKSAVLCSAFPCAVMLISTCQPSLYSNWPDWAFLSMTTRNLWFALQVLFHWHLSLQVATKTINR